MQLAQSQRYNWDNAGCGDSDGEYGRAAAKLLYLLHNVLCPRREHFSNRIGIVDGNASTIHALGESDFPAIWQLHTRSGCATRAKYFDHEHESIERTFFHRQSRKLLQLVDPECIGWDDARQSRRCDQYFGAHGQYQL